MTPIVFAHGNSFPGGTYSQVFKHLHARGFAVSAVDRFGHDPRFPVTSNWPHLVEQLAEFAGQVAAKHRGPVFLVGHSLGGILSVMAAALHPGLARGVLMLDSPLLGGWRANAVGVAKRTQVVSAMSPGRVSRSRRQHWASDDEALAHFARKKVFARWGPQVLRDYIAHGLEADGDQRVLRFHRDVETAIYNTMPHHLATLLRRHPLACPAAFIGGLGSSEMQQAGMRLTAKVAQGRVAMLDGTHLFPMEHPMATAAAIEAALLNLENVATAAGNPK